MKKQLPDFYALLDVSRTASAKEIRAAYRKKVAQYHPDRHEGNDLKELAKEKLAALNAAYDVLKDRKRRSAYDRMLAGGMGANPFLGAGAADSRNAPPRFLRPVLMLLGIAGFGIMLRYLRNPRVWIFVAIGTAVVWGITVARRRAREKRDE